MLKSESSSNVSRVRLLRIKCASQVIESLQLKVVDFGKSSWQLRPSRIQCTHKGREEKSLKSSETLNQSLL